MRRRDLEKPYALDTGSFWKISGLPKSTRVFECEGPGGGELCPDRSIFESLAADCKRCQLCAKEWRRRQDRVSGRWGRVRKAKASVG